MDSLRQALISVRGQPRTRNLLSGAVRAIDEVDQELSASRVANSENRILISELLARVAALEAAAEPAVELEPAVEEPKAVSEEPAVEPEAEPELEAVVEVASEPPKKPLLPIELSSVAPESSAAGVGGEEERPNNVQVQVGGEFDIEEILSQLETQLDTVDEIVDTKAATLSRSVVQKRKLRQQLSRAEALAAKRQ